MEAFLPFIQIILAILLTISVLLQQTGAGLGGAFGGGDTSVGFHTRRGFERTLFKITIVLAVLFVASALTALVLH
ncbi:MAG: preprotein translocase subunit SecG [bacterium]|nr:preprotein translocase subunit SecG [bacterium]